MTDFTLALDPTTVTIDSGPGYKAFPDVVKLPDGRLMMGYRHATDHVSIDGDARIRYSSNNGSTWTAPVTVRSHTVEGWDVRACGLAVMPDGTVWMSYFISDGTLYPAVKVMKSTDGGVTWSAPVTVTSSFTTVCSVPSKVVRALDGTLLLPIYGNTTGSELWTSAVVRSTDGGATWGGQVTIAAQSGPASFNETEIVLMPDGTLVALIREESSGRIFRSVSTDNGLTWSEPPFAFHGNGRPAAIVLPDASILCVYRSNLLPAGPVAVYSVGADAGLTWTPEVQLSTGHAMMYAGLTFLATGDVGIVYSLEMLPTDADLFMRTMDVIYPAQVVTMYYPVGGYPALADIRTWLKVPATILPDAELDIIAAAEQTHQARLDWGAGELPADALAAFYRRCARNAAAKNIPLGILAADAEYGTVRLSRWDAEVERLEAAYVSPVIA